MRFFKSERIILEKETARLNAHYFYTFFKKKYGIIPEGEIYFENLEKDGGGTVRLYEHWRKNLGFEIDINDNQLLEQINEAVYNDLNEWFPLFDKTHFKEYRSHIIYAYKEILKAKYKNEISFDEIIIKSEIEICERAIKALKQTNEAIYFKVAGEAFIQDYIKDLKTGNLSGIKQDVILEPLKNNDAEEYLKKIMLSNFEALEQSLFDLKYIDANRKWKEKGKEQLAELVFVLLKKRWFKAKGETDQSQRTKIRLWFENRYQSGDISQQFKPSIVKDNGTFEITINSIIEQNSR